MQKLYVKTTKDDLELPIAVADSPSELARMLGTTRGTVESSISKHHKGWHRIIIEEENEK
jgi:hypothetical protein